MSCKPTYKGVRYNSLEELYNANGVNEQQKQQAQQLYQSFLDVYLQDFLTTDGYYALEEVLVINKIIDRKCN